MGTYVRRAARTAVGRMLDSANCEPVNTESLNCMRMVGRVFHYASILPSPGCLGHLVRGEYLAYHEFCTASSCGQNVLKLRFTAVVYLHEAVIEKIMTKILHFMPILLVKKFLGYLATLESPL